MTAPSRRKRNKLVVYGLAHRSTAMTGGNAEGTQVAVGEVGAEPIVQGDWLVRLAHPASGSSPTSSIALQHRLPFSNFSPLFPSSLLHVSQTSCFDLNSRIKMPQPLPVSCSADFLFLSFGREQIRRYSTSHYSNRQPLSGPFLYSMVLHMFRIPITAFRHTG